MTSTAGCALGYADLDSWLGVENFEMRVVDDRIDRYVLGVLEEQAVAKG